MAKRVWKNKTIINDWRGRPIRVQQFEDPFDEDSPMQVGDMRVLDAMLHISNTFPCKTLDDSTKKRSLKQALLASVRTGKIELEPEVFKWLKTASEQVCPAVFRVNGSIVYEFVKEGFAKSHEPKAKTARKEEPDASAAE